jgi:hypothetical protein
MQCRDAQFYLRLRRHAGDELGADVAGDLDRHLADCPACASDARSAASFDRAVARAMTAVAVPAGLRDKLLTLASAHRGGVIRRKVYQVAALAASVFFSAGLAFGVFSASRPKIDTNALVMKNDDLIRDPDTALRNWLVSQQLPDQLPKPFNPDLLFHLGKETVQGKDVPVVIFRHPTDPGGFAKVYIFRDDGSYNLKDLQEAQASLTVAPPPATFRGAKYVFVVKLENPGDEPLRPFLQKPA